jgi:hypothetical protein
MVAHNQSNAFKISFYFPRAALMLFFKKKKLKAFDLQRRYDMIALKFLIMYHELNVDYTQ